MKIECIRSLHGPNVYSYRPVLLMRLDLGELVERESRELNGFNDRLLTLLPGIHNHIVVSDDRAGSRRVLKKELTLDTSSNTSHSN